MYIFGNIYATLSPCERCIEQRLYVKKSDMFKTLWTAPGRIGNSLSSGGYI